MIPRGQATEAVIQPPRGVTWRERAGWPGVALMNLWVYPATVGWTILSILCSPLAFAACLPACRWRADRATRLMIWLYGRGWLLLVSPFVSFSREGFAGAGASEGRIMVVNHLSFFDTYFMALLPVFDVCFAVRDWPFRMPWYAGFMRLAGYLNVEKGGWREVDRRARGVLARGGVVLFFPEGHRSRDGRLGKFHSGAFLLSTETGVPVVPLCIEGTGALLPPGRWWVAPSRVRLSALPPLDPAGYPGPLGHKRMCATARDAITRRLESRSWAPGAGGNGDA